MTVLGDFAQRYPEALPAHALEILLGKGEEEFEAVAEAYPELYAEWWPRFQRLATEFVVWEQARRPDLAAIHAELSGRLTIPLADGSVFTLTARADRIEQRRDGGFNIIDFKTGQPPGVNEVYAGFSPQLTLEAWMLMRGAFRGLPAAKETPDLIYVHTTGGREPIRPRLIKPGKDETRSVAEIVEEHRRRLEGLIARYAAGEQAYRVAALPEIRPALLRLRPSRPREGMVAGEHRRRRGTRVMDDLVVPAGTRDAQRRAADPHASAWVSANAGAGKTKVLTDRVVRLLLAGSPPGRILCLTFTKAAAANMAIRVFDRLGRWVTLDDEALVAELMALEGERPSRARLRLARTLFARAVETPGGLKIDTIHAFCERLLHLVPFEANVPARFAVLDESRTDEMREEATGTVLADATTGAYPDLADALSVVSVEAAGEVLDRALKAALRAKTFLHAEDGLGPSLARMRTGLGLAGDDTIARIEARMREDGIPAAEWPAIARELLAGKATDQKRGHALAAAALSTDPDETLALYLTVFFNKDGTPAKGPAFLTKAVEPGLLARMLARAEPARRACRRR